MPWAAFAAGTSAFPATADAGTIPVLVERLNQLRLLPGFQAQGQIRPHSPLGDHSGALVRQKVNSPYPTWPL